MAASVQRHVIKISILGYSRNHSLQNYRSAFDLASRYAYMAGKAYEYSTNLPTNHDGSVLPLLQDIVGRVELVILMESQESVRAVLARP